jgi:hypothetical protein
MKTFKMWVENMESRKVGIKEGILNFLKDELSIIDDDTILQMNTNDISPDVVSKLIERGLITSADPNVITSIKNGITIQDLIDMMVGDEHPSISIDDRILAKPATNP